MTTMLSLASTSASPIQPFLARALRHADCEAMYPGDILDDRLLFTAKAPVYGASPIADVAAQLTPTIDVAPLEAARSAHPKEEHTALSNSGYFADRALLAAWPRLPRWRASIGVGGPAYVGDDVGALPTARYLTRLCDAEGPRHRERIARMRRMSESVLRAIGNDWRHLESAHLCYLSDPALGVLPRDVQRKVRSIAAQIARSGPPDTDVLDATRLASHLFLAGALRACLPDYEDKCAASDFFFVASGQLIEGARFDAAAMAMELSASMCLEVESLGLGIAPQIMEDTLFSIARLWIKAKDEVSQRASLLPRIQRGLTYACALQEWGLAEEFLDALCLFYASAPDDPKAHEEGGRAALRSAVAHLLSRQKFAGASKDVPLTHDDLHTIAEQLRVARSLFLQSGKQNTRVLTDIAWALRAAEFEGA
jgi:hypothetical protein